MKYFILFKVLPERWNIAGDIFNFASDMVVHLLKVSSDISRFIQSLNAAVSETFSQLMEGFQNSVLRVRLKTITQ